MAIMSRVFSILFVAALLVSTIEGQGLRPNSDVFLLQDSFDHRQLQDDQPGIIRRLINWLRDLLTGGGGGESPTTSPTPGPTPLTPTPPTPTPPTPTPPTPTPPTPSPTPNPTPGPTPAPVPAGDPAWVQVPTTGTFTPRHEACFAYVDGKGYLIGGRGNNNVDVYDPSTRSWTVATGPGFELHHMHCIPLDGKVWIVSAWSGNFPRETNVPEVWIYDTVNDSWESRPGMPDETRLRGGGAAVLRGREIYVSHGNRGGHGASGTAYAYFDKYNVDTGVWTVLPDAMFVRDHTGGVLMPDDRMCVAGGRTSDRRSFFNRTVEETECYNFNTGEWEEEDPIPTERAGSMYGLTCDGKLMVAGGEGYEIAFDTVEVFDGNSWETYPSMTLPRHGTGMLVDCSCDQITIPTGSTIQGADLTSETDTTEILFPNGVDTGACP